MPSTVQLELFLVDGCSTCCWSEKVAVIDVAIPGMHTNSLTMAAPLIREHNFSMYEMQNNIKLKKARGEGNEEKVKKEIALQKKGMLGDRKKDQDVRGQVYVKAEWKGNGPHMPPVKAENLFKRGQAPKNKNTFSAEEEMKMLLKQLYIDVNDPRNQYVIKLLKETRNEYVARLLKED